MSGSGAELAGLILGIIPCAINAFEYCARAKTLERFLKRILEQQEEVLEKCHRLGLVQNLEEWKQLNGERELAFWAGGDSGLFKILPRDRTISQELGHRLCARLMQSESAFVASGSNAENCKNVGSVAIDLARISREAQGSHKVRMIDHIVDSILGFVFDPSPGQFIIGFTLLSICLAFLYRRRYGDRYQNGILAGFVLIACSAALLAGIEAVQGPMYLPATITISLLLSEAVHRCSAIPRGPQDLTDEDWEDEKRRMARSAEVGS